MKIAYTTLIGAQNAIAEISALKLSPTFRLKAARNQAALMRESETFGKVQREVLIEHARKDSDDKPVMTENGGYSIANPSAYQDAMQSLLASEVEVAIEPMALSALDDADISVGSLAALLGWYLKDGD